MNQPITVELVFCPKAELCQREQHEVISGVCLSEFLAQIQWYERFSETEALSFGVFGQKVDGDYVLKNHDRVEFYRPLPLDPMKLRKQRAMKTKKLKAKKPQMSPRLD
jgi:putative ubiquitin-RnfH superfamily antitoxin RatB of RatAB toxin-antitoxin module